VLTAPPLTFSTTAVPRAHPAGPGVAEGRAYNQHLYLLSTGGQGVYQNNAFGTPFPVTGAYYRIHMTTSFPTSGRTCLFPDMTDQIGCLVDASPCSLGYAGRGAVVLNTNTAAVKINKQSPETACIQSSFFIYPLARKLYVNTVGGFGAVNGEELQLAGCMTDLAQPSHTPPTPAGIVTTAIVSSGFLTIPGFLNNGEPYCEDFNEMELCAAASNNNACLNLKPNFDNFPEFSTICGDGQVDAFEDCDDGTANGPPPAPCSSICRNN
jgi:hypothetical protein